MLLNFAEFWQQIDRPLMKSKAQKSDRVVLFLHIPKTGGTTLKHCIYNEYKMNGNYVAEDGYLVNGIYYYPGGFYKETQIPPKVIRAMKRDDIRAVTGHFSFGIHSYISRHWTYVTLLRNPVDRVVSFYYHLRKHNWIENYNWLRARVKNKLDEKILSRDIDIEDFVLHLSCMEADNDQTRRIAGLDPEFGKCSISILNKAKENLCRDFSAVGVTERFAETLILIKRTLGWAHEPYYLPGLVNKDRPASASLPQRSVDIILERNQLDANLYEFANELLSERILDQGRDFNREVKRFITLNTEYIQKYGLPTW